MQTPPATPRALSAIAFAAAGPTPVLGAVADARLTGRRRRLEDIF
jgi:hypothetical protein